MVSHPGFTESGRQALMDGGGMTSVHLIVMGRWATRMARVDAAVEVKVRDIGSGAWNCKPW